ncbi:hypothetical protein [Streptomyces sp. IMTB 2501]|uniref:hypothetical protein n=1 Tax=Streptomyces sp. IMTB 2501 TaxID=1776340 RepID=UPI00273D60D7|nr:hypothetical protein [Streptomyces sp. IMTB 2501]
MPTPAASDSDTRHLDGCPWVSRVGDRRDGHRLRRIVVVDGDPARRQPTTAPRTALTRMSYNTSRP